MNQHRVSHPLTVVALVAAGGVLGTLLRFAVGHWIGAGPWPWATLTVNLAGALLLGWCTRLPDHRRAFLGTGFCGGLTTYSTLALEVARTAQRDASIAVAYLAVTLAAGVVAAWCGRQLAGWSHA